MDRRTFLKVTAGASALTAAGALATPAISQRAAARALRFVPTSDLANFDPIWTSADVARDAGALVWDMLYGVDDKFRPQRQMVEAEEVSSDGLTWTFRLRPGLKFHDGEPVRARDAVASLTRWAARDQMGGMIKAIQQELTTVDDRTIKWVLTKPYPKMMLALGKSIANAAFIMPERIAQTDPFRPISEYIGSGPMRFIRNEWIPGAKAVFEKFPGYVPRQEPASWLAGGKQISTERIEWIVMPDLATSAAAMQNGEIDWWQNTVTIDLVPLLRRNRNVIVGANDEKAGILRMNHLHPPFNDVRARRAILTALSQEDCMRSFRGDDNTTWKLMPGFFTPGAPSYNEEGGDILKGPRDLDAAKRLLAESGYSGEAITCLAAQDLPAHKAWGEVTADLLKRLGMAVDLVAVDFGTVVARRAQKSPPKQGGWHMFLTTLAAADCVNPAAGPYIRANGDRAWFGWPSSPQVEAEIAAWFDAKNPDDEMIIARRLNKAALDQVIYAPLGFYQVFSAWRKNVTGIVPGPLPFFWGVSKTV